jgi:hypothetical protein
VVVDVLVDVLVLVLVDVLAAPTALHTVRGARDTKLTANRFQIRHPMEFRKSTVNSLPSLKSNVEKRIQFKEPDPPARFAGVGGIKSQ